jgi:rhodanese-related sulfurtransferase
MGSIEVEELARCLAESDSSVQLIDVREPEEIEIACLPNFTVLSLSKFNEWSVTIHDQFNFGAETLVLCHHGIRSAQMCQWLETQGFTNVKNISGGIDAYSISIDRSIPRY